MSTASTPNRTIGESKLRSRLGIATLVTTMVAAAAAVAALPAPVSAAVPGLEIVTVSSDPDSLDHESATAECPDDTVVIGSGATIEGGLGQVNLESVVPTTDRVSALAYEDANGTNNVWTVTAQAVCADPPPGYSIEYTPSAQTAVNKSVTATCLGNTVLIGWGGLLSGSFGDVELESIQPDFASVTVTGNEIGAGTATPWSVYAYAICADPLPGLVTVSAIGANTAANKSVVATCPAGTRVLSAAGSLTGSGRVLLDDLFVQETTVTATGKETGNGTGTPWRVEAIAQCATP